LGAKACAPLQRQIGLLGVGRVNEAIIEATACRRQGAALTSTLPTMPVSRSTTWMTASPGGLGDGEAGLIDIDKPSRRPALDAAAVDRIPGGTACAGGLLDRAGLRHLFPAHPDDRPGGHDGASLSARSIGVAAGVLFLDESLTPAAWVGLACVITGVAAMTLPSGRPAPRRK
jgi:hypothetical protein